MGFLRTSAGSPFDVLEAGYGHRIPHPDRRLREGYLTRGNRDIRQRHHNHDCEQGQYREHVPDYV